MNDPKSTGFLFNLSFLFGILHNWNIFKTSKITIYKKDSKYSKYQPIRLLSNIDEIFERVYVIGFIRSFEKSKLYSFQIFFRQTFNQHSKLENSWMMVIVVVLFYFFWLKLRSRHQRCSMEKGVLRNFAKRWLLSR